jgi:hypothetical protein
MSDFVYAFQDRAATAEKRFQKGWNTLRQAYFLKPFTIYFCLPFSNTALDLLSTCFREEGRAIQSELNQISDIEKQAVGV